MIACLAPADQAAARVGVGFDEPIPDGQPGNPIGDPDGLEVRRWPTRYLTPYVTAIERLFADCDRAHVPPLTCGLVAWPASLAAAWSVLRTELERRKQVSGG